MQWVRFDCSWAHFRSCKNSRLGTHASSAVGSQDNEQGHRRQFQVSLKLSTTWICWKSLPTLLVKINIWIKALERKSCHLHVPKCIKKRGDLINIECSIALAFLFNQFKHFISSQMEIFLPCTSICLSLKLSFSMEHVCMCIFNTVCELLGRLSLYLLCKITVLNIAHDYLWSNWRYFLWIHLLPSLYNASGSLMRCMIFFI